MPRIVHWTDDSRHFRLEGGVVGSVCTDRSNSLGAWTSRYTEAEAGPDRPVPEVRHEGDRRRVLRRRGNGPSARPICCARWANSDCSACSCPRSGAASACRPSGSSPPSSSSARPTSRSPRRSRPTSRSVRCRCTCSATTSNANGGCARWPRDASLGAFGLTEPDAGSDIRGITTRAVRQDGGWLINGRKAFISNAGTDMSFGVTLLARTETGTGRRGRQVRQLRRREGHARVHDGAEDARHRLARASTPASCSSTTCGSPTTISSAIPNSASGQFLGALEVGRISIAALSLSLTQAVLDMSLDYARQRQQFGQPIGKFQAIQFKLADMATELEAARWLTYRAAYLRDAGQPFLKEASMAKLKASRLAAAGCVRGGADPRRASATCSSRPWPASTATPRCSRSARAPTRSSTSSSPAPSAADRVHEAARPTAATILLGYGAE